MGNPQPSSFDSVTLESHTRAYRNEYGEGSTTVRRTTQVEYTV